MRVELRSLIFLSFHSNACRIFRLRGPPNAYGSVFRGRNKILLVGEALKCFCGIFQKFALKLLKRLKYVRRFQRKFRNFRDKLLFFACCVGKIIIFIIYICYNGGWGGGGPPNLERSSKILSNASIKNWKT